MRKILLLTTSIVCLLSCSTRDENRIYTKFDPVSLKKDFESFRQIIKYAHPGKYFHCSPKELDKLFDSVENTLDKEHTEIEFYQKLLIITKKIACAHTSLSPSDILSDSLFSQNILFPIPMISIDSKFYVNTDNADIPFAAEVLSINNKQPDELVKQISAIKNEDGNSTSYEQENIARGFYFNNYVVNGPQKNYEIKYRINVDSAILSKKIEAKNAKYILSQYDGKVYSLNTAAEFDLEILKNKSTAVLTLRSFDFIGSNKEESYLHFLENSFKLIKYEKIKNLVIDVRENTGGNYSNAMLTYAYLGKRKISTCKKAWMIFDEIPYTDMVDEEDKKQIESINEMRKSEFKNKNHNIYYLDSSHNEIYDVEKENHFDGKIFVLTNSKTVSCGAYFASLLKDEAKAIIVGTETGGGATQHSGFQGITYMLPLTKIKLSFSIAAVVHSLQNKKQNVHRGVMPDYNKTITYKDFSVTNDTQLNFILDSLINKN